MLQILKVEVRIADSKSAHECSLWIKWGGHSPQSHVKLICLLVNIKIVKVVPTSTVLEYLIVILCLQGSTGSCHLSSGVIWADCLTWH